MKWENLDPARVERGVQLLLRKRYPGLTSFDGAGGDGGRDAQLVTPDGSTVFEVKSFGRLTSSRRRQIKSSLLAALDAAPEMTRWVLVIPMLMTPSSPTRKSSEQSWFYETLAAAAPGVELVWWGQDWLDEQLADNMDVQRYIEGVDGQLLQRAAEFDQEQAVLARGAVDLRDRLVTLKRRVDEVSPHWTLDFAVDGEAITSTLRGKTDDAHLLDPITFKPTFHFEAADTEEQDLRQRLEDVVDFGGTVHIPAGHVTELNIEASPEARLLIPSDDPNVAEFSIISAREDLDRHVRCIFEVLDPDETVVSSFSFFVRQRASGRRGVTLYGSDAVSIVSIELGLPFPSHDSGAGRLLVGDDAHLNVKLPDTLVGLDITSLAPILRTLDAARMGRRLRIKLPDLGDVDGPPLDEPIFSWTPPHVELVEDLHRMEQHTGRVLSYPEGVTDAQARELHAAVLQLDGEEVVQDGVLTLTIRQESLGTFLQTLDQTPTEQAPGGFLHATDSYELTVGNLTLMHGAAAFWAPQPRLLNRAELDDALSSPEGSYQDGVKARFEPTDAPFRWVSRQQAEEYVKARLEASE